MNIPSTPAPGGKVNATPHNSPSLLFTDQHYDDLADVNEVPKWNARHELTLKMWAEESICWQKMHDLSHAKYEMRNLQLTLPVIIMSTITGTANFALSSFQEPWKSRIPVIIGSVNILSGMVTTIAQYLRVNEKSEGHRVAALAYGKLTRSIASELSLPREERSSSGLPLFKLCRAEMDRLEEQSPEIMPQIALLFDTKFGDDINFENIARPANLKLRSVDICTNDVVADINRRRSCSLTPTNSDKSNSDKFTPISLRSKVLEHIVRTRKRISREKSDVDVSENRPHRKPNSVVTQTRILGNSESDDTGEQKENEAEKLV